MDTIDVSLELLPHGQSRHLLAEFLRTHAEQIARGVVDSFKGLRTGPVGYALSEQQNYDWALEGIYTVANQLDGNAVDPTQYEAFSVSGDKYSEPFLPLEYYVESRLHIAQVVAPLIWNAYTFDRATMNELLGCLESYTQRAIAANTMTFLDELCQPKAVRRHWDLGSSVSPTDAEQTRPNDNPLTGLTERERQIVELVAQGKSNGEICGALDIKLNTVKGHMQHIFDKLGAASRTEVALIALQGRAK